MFSDFYYGPYIFGLLANDINTSAVAPLQLETTKLRMWGGDL